MVTILGMPVTKTVMEMAYSTTGAITVLISAMLIKLTATGGVLSLAKSGQNPQFQMDELEALITTASEYGMGVAAHAHGTEGMRRAVVAGTSGQCCASRNRARLSSALRVMRTDSPACRWLQPSRGWRMLACSSCA